MASFRPRSYTLTGWGAIAPEGDMEGKIFIPFAGKRNLEVNY